MTTPLGGEFPPAPDVPLRNPEWWYAQALSVTLGFEGGYEPPDPTDPGAKGGTNRGITQVTYDRWRRGQGLPTRDVRDLEDSELQALYRDNYWTAGHGPDLVAHNAGHLACCHFDGCVNHGDGESERLLQGVVHATVDGEIGPETLAAVDVAINAHGEAPVVYGYLLARRDLYRDILATHPDREKWRANWMRRLERLCVAHLGSDWLKPDDWT